MPCQRRLCQAHAHQRPRQTRVSRARPQTHRSSKERRSSRTSAPATPVQEPHTAPAGAIPNHSAVTPWLRPKRIPGKNKEQRHVKREDRVPQGRGIWDGVPHNDQNNCNPLCNIDPVEPFASHSEPFKAAAHKMKKAQTTKRSGLNKRWCSMADSNRRPWD